MTVSLDIDARADNSPLAEDRSLLYPQGRDEVGIVAHGERGELRAVVAVEQVMTVDDQKVIRTRQGEPAFNENTLHTSIRFNQHLNGILQLVLATGREGYLGQVVQDARRKDVHRQAGDV
jgi:hypothetical protein